MAFKHLEFILDAPLCTCKDRKNWEWGSGNQWYVRCKDCSQGIYIGNNKVTAYITIRSGDNKDSKPKSAKTSNTDALSWAKEVLISYNISENWVSPDHIEDVAEAVLKAAAKDKIRPNFISF